MLKNYEGWTMCKPRPGYAVMPRCTASDNDAKKCMEGKECACVKPKNPAPAAIAA